MTKHKHADLIVAWASGEIIEILDYNTNKWVENRNPDWRLDPKKIRIKPKLLDFEAHVTFDKDTRQIWQDSRLPPNVKFTFDLNTGELVHFTRVK